MNILITGGGGFIGSNAANTFADEGHDVIVLDNFSFGSKEHLSPAVRVVMGDVTHPNDLASLETPDAIIHLAGSSSAPMFADNLTVMPPNFYAATKYAQEKTSHIFSNLHGMEIIAFRFMSVYGTHEEHNGKFANVLTQFIWGIEQKKNPVIYGDGTQTRDFTHVRDIIQAFRLTLETPKQFGFAVFNVGTAKEVSMNKVITTINRVMGTAYNPVYIENPITKGYITNQQADLTKITRELGYQPKVTLEDGIREIVEFRKKNPSTPVSLSF